MSKVTQYEFSSQNLVKELSHLSEKGITEFYVHDEKLSKNKSELLFLINEMTRVAPDVFYTIRVAPSALDKDIVRASCELGCSLEIPLEGTVCGGVQKISGGARNASDARKTSRGAQNAAGAQKASAGSAPRLLFDKKLLASKARLLNENDVVFGFTMSWGLSEGDTFKAFRDRLDFATGLYPNHIEFAQFEDGEESLFPKPTGIFSSKDMDFARGMAFACRTFYSAGRAVPWFNTVIQSLKISPSQFFADFDEWQQCNNCSMDTGFVPEEMPHSELEKLQLKFLKEKFEEKHKSHLFEAASDLIRLHGAFSRLTENGEECVVETAYNPEDILSPYAMNLSQFAENVTMEACSVRIFDNDGMPDFKLV